MSSQSRESVNPLVAENVRRIGNPSRKYGVEFKKPLVCLNLTGGEVSRGGEIPVQSLHGRTNNPSYDVRYATFG